MNMPITMRRRQHFLLGRYVERDNAAAKGKTNLPPIEMEDQISTMTQQLSQKPWEQSQVNQVSEPSAAGLPQAVKDALAKLESEGKLNMSTSTQQATDNSKVKRLTIRPPDAPSVSNQVNTKEELPRKPIATSNSPQVVNLSELPPPKTLKEASDRLKQKKVSIPQELVALIKEKK